MALAVTKDGAWEVIDGQRIYEKEVIKDDTIPGHTILKVRTFEKGTNRIKQPNGQMDTIHLFDNAQSCIQYYDKSLQSSQYYGEIAEITSKYDEDLKTFMPVIKDKYGDTYEKLFLWAFQVKGPLSKQPK